MELDPEPSSHEAPPWAQSLLAHFQQRDQEQSARIAALEDALGKAAQKGVTEASAPIGTTPADPHRRPRARLPDPAKFAGDRADWPAWKTTMENKLMVDGSAVGELADQFLYVYSRLEGNAWKNVTTFVTLRRSNGTPSAFFTYLESLYGDPNAKTRAASRLHELKQGEHQSFAKFLPVLEREIADAGALEWHDDAKRPIILRALNSQLSNALVSRGIPGTFQEIINTLHSISTDIDMLNVQKGSRKESQQPRTTQPNANRREEVYLAGDAMDWAPTTTVSTGRAQVTNPGGFRSSRPEDQPLLGKRAQWVAKEVINQRLAEGRCLRCGRDGCVIRRCPLKAAVRPATATPPKARSNNTRTSRTKVTEAAYVDNEMGGELTESSDEESKD
jgi:hypothetical protein